MPAGRKRTETSSLAGDASERVRAIIEAAETTAAQIRAAAEEDAERIRSEAHAEAEAVLGRLRQGVERLAQELDLPADRSNVSAVTAQREVEVPPPPPPEVPAMDEDEDVQLAQDATVDLDENASDPERESARLVALNMALDGAPRDEVEKYLEENFRFPERGTLLDEVYSTVGR